MTADAGLAADALHVMDVGGTHVTAALVDTGDLRVLHRRTDPLDADGDADALLAALGGCASGIGGGLIGTGATWSVAMPGPFDYAAGVGTFDGVGKFAALAGLDLRTPLAARLSTSPERVRFLNDADAYALGEWTAHDRPERLLCVTLGTGVGGGFVERGEVLVDDARVPPGGDLHPLTWHGDPLEDHVSRRAIVRASGSDDHDVREIAALALGGDAGARRVLRRAMTVLAETLEPWVASFAPDVVVVGGAIARSWHVTGAWLAEALPSAEIRPARLGDDAPLVGAAEALRRATGHRE